MDRIILKELPTTLVLYIVFARSARKDIWRLCILLVIFVEIYTAKLPIYTIHVLLYSVLSKGKKSTIIHMSCKMIYLMLIFI